MKPMNASMNLGRVSGIEIGVHWTVAIIALLVGSTVAGTVLPAFVPGHTTATYMMVAAAMVVAFLASIVAHELGHSLVAQRNGVRVRHITLFALGGVAALEEEPTEPGMAARIALAGPAVSLGLGLAGIALFALVPTLGAGPLVATSVLWIGLMNLTLAVFNMIPALPLDGGRVLQAALWHRNRDRHRATITAARLGRVLGLAIVGVGLWEFATAGSGLWTAFVGWFIITSAGAEARQAKIQRRMEQLRHRNDAFAQQWASVFAPFAAGPAPRPAQQIIDVSGRPLNSDTVPR